MSQQDKPKMTKQQAIDELRKEAQDLEDRPCALSDVAKNAHKAKIRRNLADKLEQEQTKENNQV